jgi:hypothetical protein
MHWERRTRSLIVQGVFWLVVLQVVSTCGAEPKRQRTERIPNPGYSPKRGDLAMLYGYDAKRDRVYPVEAQKSSFAYEEYWRSLDIGDDEGADEVVRRGDSVKVPPKTGVLVLEVRKYPEEDPRQDCAVVRIQDGPLKGMKFYVAVFHVCQLMENPYFDPPGTPMPDPRPTEESFDEKVKNRRDISAFTPAEIKKIHDAVSRQRADSNLNIAENLRKSGKNKQARKYYEIVVKEYGSHPEAKLARERLKTLPR